MESLDGIGYLYNPELVEEMLNKLPSTMISGYVQYAARLEGPTTSNLNISAEFLYAEAQIYAAVGLVNLSSFMAPETQNVVPKLKSTHMYDLFGEQGTGTTCCRSSSESECVRSLSKGQSRAFKL